MARIAAIESGRIGIGNGEIVGDGRVSVTGAGPSEAHVRWRNLDVGALSRTSSALSVRPAALADGDLSVAWTGADFAGARGRLVSTLRDLPASTNAVPISGRVEMSLENQRWTAAADSRVAGSRALAIHIGISSVLASLLPSS